MCTRSDAMRARRGRTRNDVLPGMISKSTSKIERREQLVLFRQCAAREEVTLMPRVPLVTGASRGIGAAAALLLAERGFRVVVNYRASAPQAAEVVASIIEAGGEAIAIHPDVTSTDDVTGMMVELRSDGTAWACSCATR